MGYRGKLMVEHTGIELPNELVKKYEEDYYIAKGENGKAYVNISSKNETKGHYEILSDLQDLLKGNSFYVYAVILWEDGRIDKYNLSSGEQKTFRADDY
jgi:hypothetical protein